jgi:hypothetical protein
MNFNDIDKKTFKKNVTKCLGHHYAIWTSDSNFLLAQKNVFGPAKGWPSLAGPHFKHCSEEVDNGTSSNNPLRLNIVSLYFF